MKSSDNMAVKIVLVLLALVACVAGSIEHFRAIDCGKDHRVVFDFKHFFDCHHRYGSWKYNIERLHNTYVFTCYGVQFLEIWSQQIIMVPGR